ncbi:hypothetical protein PFISCL1PPCAC_4045, partial [Pristionchus fissidentatus]
SYPHICLLFLLLALAGRIECDEFDIENDMPDPAEISEKLNRNLALVCTHITNMESNNKVAKMYADFVERSIPIKEFKMQEMEGLFKLGSRGLVRYLVDEFETAYGKNKKEEFEVWCIDFTRKLAKK